MIFLRKIMTKSSVEAVPMEKSENNQIPMINTKYSKKLRLI